MTNCCHCSGVTPPPQPPEGACCWGFDISTRQCQDSVEVNTCLSRAAGVHYPDTLCSAVTCDVAPPTCFIGDSPVLMADGSYKRISEVSVGEKVKSIDNQINTVTHIEKTILGNRKLASVNSSDFFFSYDHPILTQDGFKSLDVELSRKLYSDIDFVGNLEIGDTIFTETGEKTVDDIKTEDSESNYDTPLYDLTLDGNHIYYVNGIAFHNCSYGSWCCPGTVTGGGGDYSSPSQNYRCQWPQHQWSLFSMKTLQSLVTPANNIVCNDKWVRVLHCNDCPDGSTTTTTTADPDATTTTTTTTTTLPPEGDKGCCFEQLGVTMCEDMAKEVCEGFTWQKSRGVVLQKTCSEYDNPCGLGTCCTETCEEDEDGIQGLTYTQKCPINENDCFSTLPSSSIGKAANDDCTVGGTRTRVVPLAIGNGFLGGTIVQERIALSGFAILDNTATLRMRMAIISNLYRAGYLAATEDPSSRVSLRTGAGVQTVTVMET
jgi:hypothetical protein